MSPNTRITLFRLLVIVGMGLFAWEQYLDGAGYEHPVVGIVGTTGMMIVFAVLWIWGARYSK